MIRVGGVACSVVLAAVLACLAVAETHSYLIPAVLVTVTASIGVYDLLQRQHSVLRHYPVLGHLRFLLEAIRPEIQQYFIERNFDGRPFDREVRSLIYQRAKGTAAEQSYGTERDISYAGYEYLLHSVAPVDPAPEPFRVRIGGPDCTQPYDMALMNISSMSFGSLSGNALRAEQRRAQRPLRPRHRRRRTDSVPSGRRRRDLGDRVGLLRYAKRGRFLRPAVVRR